MTNIPAASGVTVKPALSMEEAVDSPAVTFAVEVAEPM